MSTHDPTPIPTATLRTIPGGLDWFQRAVLGRVEDSPSWQNAGELRARLADMLRGRHEAVS